MHDTYLVGSMEEIQNSTSGFYGSTISVEQWRLQRTEERIAALIPNTIMLCSFLVIGVIGNTTILYFYNHKIRDKKERENRAFITYLAAIDICACVLGTTFGILLNYIPFDFNYPTVCKTFWFSTKVAVFSSGFLLVVIAAQRYWMICMPLRSQMGPRTKRIAVVLVVVSSCIVSSPVPVLFGTHEIDMYRGSKGVTCGKEKAFDMQHRIYDIVLDVIGGVGLITITVLYILIGRVIIKRIRLRRKHSDQKKSVAGYKIEQELSQTSSDKDSVSPATRTISRPQSTDGHLLPSKIVRARKGKLEELRFFLMFIVINLIFVISYAPRVAVSLLENANKDFWIQDDEGVANYLFLYRMYIINNIANPIIYGVFDARLREEFWKVFCKCM